MQEASNIPPSCPARGMFENSSASLGKYQVPAAEEAKNKP